MLDDMFNNYIQEQELAPVAKMQTIYVGSTRLEVEMLDTPEELERGLKNRENLPDNHGALFIYPNERILNFWMKDTLLKLDIAFIDRKGKIIDIQKMIPLEDVEENEQPRYQSPIPAKFALEVNEGWFDKNDIQVGDYIKFMNDWGKATIFFLPVDKRPDTYSPLSKDFKGIYWHTGIIYNGNVYETFDNGKESIMKEEIRKPALERLDAEYIEEVLVNTNKLNSEINSGADCAEYVARVVGMSKLKGPDKGQYYPEDIYNYLKREYKGFVMEDSYIERLWKKAGIDPLTGDEYHEENEKGLIDESKRIIETHIINEIDFRDPNRRELTDEELENIMTAMGDPFKVPTEVFKHLKPTEFERFNKIVNRKVSNRKDYDDAANFVTPKPVKDSDLSEDEKVRAANIKKAVDIYNRAKQTGKEAGQKFKEKLKRDKVWYKYGTHGAEKEPVPIPKELPSTGNEKLDEFQDKVQTDTLNRERHDAIHRPYHRKPKLKEPLPKDQTPDRYRREEASYILENTASHDFGCVMLETPIKHWDKIKFLIEANDVYQEEGYGLEDKPHVTVLYGLHDTHVDHIKYLLEDHGPVKYSIAGIGSFTPEDKPYEVVYFIIESEQLIQLNQKLREFPHTMTYPEYKPHMTIAYVNKGCSKKYVRRFKEMENYWSGTFNYSPSDGTGMPEMIIETMTASGIAGYESGGKRKKPIEPDYPDAIMEEKSNDEEWVDDDFMLMEQQVEHINEDSETHYKSAVSSDPRFDPNFLHSIIKKKPLYITRKSDYLCLWIPQNFIDEKGKHTGETAWLKFKLNEIDSGERAQRRYEDVYWSEEEIKRMIKNKDCELMHKQNVTVNSLVMFQKDFYQDRDPFVLGARYVVKDVKDYGNIYLTIVRYEPKYSVYEVITDTDRKDKHPLTWDDFKEGTLVFEQSILDDRTTLIDEAKSLLEDIEANKDDINRLQAIRLKIEKRLETMRPKVFNMLEKYKAEGEPLGTITTEFNDKGRIRDPKEKEVMDYAVSFLEKYDINAANVISRILNIFLIFGIIELVGRLNIKVNTGSRLLDRFLGIMIGILLFFVFKAIVLILISILVAGVMQHRKKYILEYIVPQSMSLKEWKAYRKKHNIGPKDYHKKNPSTKWKVVHGHAEKGNKVGDTIKGNLSYNKAKAMHAAIILNKNFLIDK